MVGDRVTTAGHQDTDGRFSADGMMTTNIHSQDRYGSKESRTVIPKGEWTTVHDPRLKNHPSNGALKQELIEAFGHPADAGEDWQHIKSEDLQKFIDILDKYPESPVEEKDEENGETAGPEEIMAAIEAMDPDALVNALVKAFGTILGTDVRENVIRETREMVETFMAELQEEDMVSQTFGFGDGLLKLSVVKIKDRPASVTFIDTTFKKEYESKWKNSAKTETEAKPETKAEKIQRIKKARGAWIQEVDDPVERFIRVEAWKILGYSRESVAIDRTEEKVKAALKGYEDLFVVETREEGKEVRIKTL